MKENLLIIFVKNIVLGKVKTRLAKTVGDDAAFQVYKYLVEITERETENLEDFDKHIYFSDVIIEIKWKNDKKFVQKGNDLGERMKNAFQHGFDLGYKNVIGLGSDLPDLTKNEINLGLTVLKEKDVVFGPASDGGYYLIGMNKMISSIFENKPWSTNYLLKETLIELKEQNISFDLIKELNDIDTLEDLKTSTIKEKFKHLTR